MTSALLKGKTVERLLIINILPVEDSTLNNLQLEKENLFLTKLTATLKGTENKVEI